MSARRKQSAVLRLLRGEDLELVSRELGVTAAELGAWRDAFVAAGEAALKTRDGELVAAIRDLLAEGPFHGEGDRKIWARLRFAGIRTSKRRVLRLTAEHGLQAPGRVGRPRTAQRRTTARSAPSGSI